MASIGSVTRQIAALEISSKQNAPAKPSGATHHKKGSQSVSKLLSKYAPPPVQSSTIQKAASTSAIATKATRAETTQAVPTHNAIDIGRYDGGFEIDNEVRGERVYGEAAVQLALDSSVSRCVKATFSKC